MLRIAVSLAMAASMLAAGPGATPSETDAPRTIIVKMVDVSPTEYVFEPANVTANPGDIVRFVQTTSTPHNVQFKEGPIVAALGAKAMGPFLTTPDATYDVVIDDNFAPGTYNFVCTPHEFMGMTGTITVEEGN